VPSPRRWRWDATALRLFAADHTPSSITAVPLPEGGAKRIDETVQGRVCACSAFDVHVLSGSGAERVTEGRGIRPAAPWQAGKTFFGKKTIANGSFAV